MWVQNMKTELTNELKPIDDRKIWTKPRGRSDASKTFLTNLIYMVDLKDTLKMIIPFYWNPGKTIIDVTAGRRLIWGHFGYNHLSSCGMEHWHVEFNDIEETTKADYHLPANEIDKLGKHWDILVIDLPFVELKDGVESFGVRARQREGRIKFNDKTKFRREFYFNRYEPLDKAFPKCVKAFNKVADNLIVKMGNSHKNKRAIMNCTEAELAFDSKRNPESEFNLIDSIGYRGNYARRGGRFPFAQSVMSYYMIFKKDVSAR